MNEWLQGLENEYRDTPLNDVVLWKGSVRHDMQSTIAQMQGATDLESSELSRPNMIVPRLGYMVSEKLLPHDFSVIDIACGDGLILQAIKKSFPQSRCYGIDINKGNVDEHRMVQAMGVELYRIPIQGLFDRVPEEMFDISMMLNTYRGWNAAGLRESEADLPDKADYWLRVSSRFSILTVNDWNMSRLSKDYVVHRLGQGEQVTNMIMVEWK